MFLATSEAVDVAVSGSLAYIAGGDRLRIVDISDPSAPVDRGYVRTPGFARGVSVSGNLVLIGGGYANRLLIVDVSAPSAPVVAGVVPIPGFIFGSFISGGHAFVTDGNLSVVNLGVFVQAAAP